MAVIETFSVNKSVGHVEPRMVTMPSKFLLRHMRKLASKSAQ